MAETVTPGRLLTVRETSERLGVHTRTVERLIARGDLAAVKLGRGRNSPVRVDERDLDEFVYGDPTSAA